MRMGLDTAYVIKAESGKDIYYHDSKDGGWTTLVWCTKFGLYREAKAVLEKLKESTSDWLKNIRIVKCKLVEE